MIKPNHKTINQLSSLVSKGVELGKVFLLNVIGARELGADGFGVVSFVISIASIIIIIAEFRMQDIVIKRISSGESKNTVISEAVILNVFFGTACFIAIAAISQITQNSTNWGTPLSLYAITFIISSLKPLKYALIALRDNYGNAIIEISSFTISATAYILIWRENFSIDAYFYIRIIDSIAVSLLCIIIFFARHSASPSLPTTKNLKTLISTSTPLVASGLITISIQKIDQIIIGLFMGDSSLGIYSAAINIITIFSIPPLIFSQTNAPDIHEATQNADEKHKKRIAYIKNSCMVGAAMSAILLISGQYITTKLYGLEFIKATPILYISFLTPLIISIGAASTQIIISDNKTHGIFQKSIIALVVSISLNLLLIPSLGIAGAAIATTTSLLASNVLSNIIIRRYHYIWKMQKEALQSITRKM